MTGTSIMNLTACGVTVKDSKNFLPMALSALPKAFNLTELKKGFFPYKFDTPENQNYVDLWPAAHFYMPGKMSPAKKIEFEAWYSDKPEKVGDPYLLQTSLTIGFALPSVQLLIFVF